MRIGRTQDVIVAEPLVHPVPGPEAAAAASPAPAPGPAPARPTAARVVVRR